MRMVGKIRKVGEKKERDFNLRYNDIKDRKAMEIRTEIYGSLRDALGSVGEVAHVDLWNRNVSYIEQEVAWPRPAVFVEFQPIRWEPLTGGASYMTHGKLLLHIVTDWDMACWELSRVVAEALHGLSGEHFDWLRLEESETNHNHEEIVETIDIYSYRGRMRYDTADNA